MINLIQGTDSWRSFRKGKVTATDIPVIMMESPYTTQLQLFNRKKGYIPEQETTPAMERGSFMEDFARRKFEYATGVSVNPDVVVSKEYPWLMASLDGISSDRKIVVEIKSPGHKDHSEAVMERVPAKYVGQLQCQMVCAEVDTMFYCSFDGNEIWYFRVFRNEDYIKTMLKKGKEFWDRLQNDDPPPETEKDFRVINEVTFDFMGREYVKAKKEREFLQAREEQLKKDLIEFCNDQSSIGGGLKFRKVIRKGSINYNDIVELKNVDLEKYRKDSISFWNITEL